MKKCLLILLLMLIIPNFVSADKIDIKYYKTIIDKINNTSYTSEITQDEYDNIKEISLFSTYHETEYKKILIEDIAGEIFMQVDWKKIRR